MLRKKYIQYQISLLNYLSKLVWWYCVPRIIVHANKLTCGQRTEQPLR